MEEVDTRLRLSVVYNISEEIVVCVFVRLFGFLRQQITKIYIPKQGTELI